MEQISTAALVYLLAVIALNYALLKRGQKKYGAMVKPLSKKEFALKDFFPIGFVLMELSRWRYGSALDRKLRRQLIELYEPDYTEYYLRVLWAAAASYLAIGALLSAVLFLGAGAAGLVFGWGIGAAMAYVSFGDLQKKIERRHLQIAIDMPDFTNKILILSGAGMTIRAALLKISHEMAADTPLYEELAHTVQMLENGATDETALDWLSVRCNTPQMRRFTSVILQNSKRGGSDVVGVLQEIGREQWSERKEAAKRVSEEADTKLLFPMILMLASVILMTVAPAVMAIQM